MATTGVRGGDSSPSIGLGSRRKHIHVESSTFLLSSPSPLNIKSTTIPVDRDEVVGALEEKQQEDAKPKSVNDLWFIHGDYYDLEPFIESHPGGRTILIMSKGMADATPLTESYHAFANKDYIAKTMAKYKVSYTPLDLDTKQNTQIEYTFEPNGFYSTLVSRVRAHFGAKGLNQSVTKSVKANRWWALKVFAQTAVALGAYATAFVLPMESFEIKAASAALSAITIVALGMTCMHDGSHYAIGERDSWKNKLAMRIWNGVSMWTPEKWTYHHTVKHHAFTGDEQLDPDTMHAKPFVRKTLLANRSKYLRFPAVLAAERWFWALYSLAVYAFSPGMFVGQIISYRIIWPLKGRLWRMSPVPKGAFTRYLWEDAISVAMVAAQVYQGSPLLSFIFLTLCNMTYAMCIIPDHDTFESAIENHVATGKIDWGEVQARHSSDFGGKGLTGRAFTQMFGGINLQIGHHLLPSVNHVYLPELVPIIKQTCAEFNVPYAEQGSVPQALWSFVRTVHACMGSEDDGTKGEH